MPAANPLFVLLPAPGPHPDPDTLRQYAAGALAPAEQQRVEAHTLDCERCADLLEGFSMSDAPSTDRAVAALRARLQARVGAAPAEPLPARPLWPRLTAAAAVAGLLAGSIWGWEQYGARPEPPLARTEAAPPAALPEPPAPAQPGPVTPAEEPAPVADAIAAAPAVPAPAATARVRPARPLLAGRTNRAKPAAPAVAAAPTETTAAVAPEPPVAAAPAAAAPDLALADRPEQNEPKALSEAEVAEPAAAKAKAARAARPAVGQEAEARRTAAMPASPTVAPAPLGGTLALREYLRRSAAQFDPELNELNKLTKVRLTGSVHVRFTVGDDGKVSNVKVTRGLRADYDAEAQRIVCDGPAWQPGIAGGRRAALPVDVVVPF